MVTRGVLLLVAGLFAAGEARAQEMGRGSDEAACRCVQEPLEVYYSRADEVVMATLLAATDGPDDRAFRMIVDEVPWKLAPNQAGSLRTGSEVEYRTAASSAACGLQPVPGATYVVFAYLDGGGPGPLRIDSCSGTRPIRTPAGDTFGFVDVPPRFVASQLDALSGLDVLRRTFSALGGSQGERLIGLLELPSLEAGGVIRLRADPRPDAPVIADVTSFDEILSKEVDYEGPAAVVVARDAGRFAIRMLDGGRGWVPETAAGAWHPFEELPVERLSYLTSEWSGHVWPEPGAGIPLRSTRKDPESREEYPVEVLESVVVAGSVWFRIALLREDPCQGGSDDVDLAGWIPGYGQNGEPSVWYYSRGC